MKESIKNISFKIVKERFKALPVDIAILGIFAVSWFVGLTLFKMINKELYLDFLSYYGGSGEIYYFHILFAILLGLMSTVFSNWQNVTRFFIIVFMGVNIYSALSSHLSKASDFITHYNPYLRYDPEAIYFTAGIPALIILFQLLMMLAHNRKAKPAFFN